MSAGVKMGVASRQLLREIDWPAVQRTVFAKHRYLDRVSQNGFRRRKKDDST